MAQTTLAEALRALLEAEKLTPSDCYDASGKPNANWGAIDRATKAARVALKSHDDQVSSPLNGVRVSRVNRTIFIPLPRELWKPCGNCQCGHCGGKEAFWDTLAVSTQDADRHTWTVHAPELHQNGGAR